MGVCGGLVGVRKGATNIVANVQCDALMMDAESKSNTFPYMDIKENSVEIAHEATVGRISKEQIFYLMSRGLDEETATKMIVSGFVEPIVKELPMEYAVELNRLIELEMDGSLGSFLTKNRRSTTQRMRRCQNSSTASQSPSSPILIFPR